MPNELFQRARECDVDLPSILQEVLDGAMELQGADFGDVQLYDEAIGALNTVAHRGVNQEFLNYFQTVDVNEPEKSGLESSVEAGSGSAQDRRR